MTDSFTEIEETNTWTMFIEIIVQADHLRNVEYAAQARFRRNRYDMINIHSISEVGSENKWRVWAEVQINGLK